MDEFLPYILCSHDQHVTYGIDGESPGSVSFAWSSNMHIGALRICKPGVIEFPSEIGTADLYDRWPRCESASSAMRCGISLPPNCTSSTACFLHSFQGGQKIFCCVRNFRPCGVPRAGRK